MRKEHCNWRFSGPATEISASVAPGSFRHGRPRVDAPHLDSDWGSCVLFEEVRLPQTAINHVRWRIKAVSFSQPITTATSSQNEELLLFTFVRSSKANCLAVDPP